MASLHLTLDLANQLYQPDTNLLFSPHSLMTALAMVLLGARGQTKSQLNKAMFNSSSGDDAAEQLNRFIELNSKLQDANGKVLQTANLVYWDRRYVVLKYKIILKFL